MILHVTRIDPTLPLPEYKTSGAVAFDLITRADTTIAPNSLGLVPSNIIVAIPEGYMLTIASRSSTPRKKGLMVPHGIGVIDQDYCGPNDELCVQVYNFTETPVTILRGERIAQCIVSPVIKCELVEKPISTEKNRGGFGTTG